MTLKDRKIANYGAMALLAVAVGLAMGYQIKVVWQNAQPVTHESALPWSALEEGWRAMKKDDAFLYGDTLKQLQSMKGKDIVLFGYMLPIEAGEAHRHFLFSSRTSSCPFCMPASAGNLVEIHTDDALPYRNEAFLLQGHFHIEDSEHSELIYSLDHAHAVEEK